LPYLSAGCRDLLDAAQNGDRETVKCLVAEGADVKESNRYGFTPFMRAAWHGHIPIMHWLLTEGGSTLTEQSTIRTTALLLAARGAHVPAVQYLLDERGASISESDNFGRTVWKELWNPINSRGGSADELSSLLKVMVVLDDAPTDFIAKLLPHDAELCTRGRLLRVQLPSYLEQQRAAVVAHCSLSAVLQSLVAVYATATPEDMWADGLRVEAPRVKRGRTGVEEEDDAEDARITKTNRRIVNSWV
jgi:hypothetical protein